MEIKMHEIAIRDIVEGYVDNDESGVFAYGGKLNVRPPYQREFIYNDNERMAVIDSIYQGFPLNVMYWSKNSDGTFEIIDGQQRTLSICQFFKGDFHYIMRFYSNLANDEKEKFLNYKLMIYFCEGTDSEKLKWFQTINIAGKTLTAQELLNAIYSGPWVTDAKKYFSKTGCPAYLLAKQYMSGTPIRQDYLETVIRWINEDCSNATYMALKQNVDNATELWLYFNSVITWVRTVFTTYRKQMNGIDWGLIYNKYKDVHCNPTEMEEKVSKLMQDEEITNKKGIYWYVFDGKEKHLNIRVFADYQKDTMYERQGGICPICKEHFEIDQMEADHVIPWCEGGKTELSNGQMLCKKCNREKSNN